MIHTTQDILSDAAKVLMDEARALMEAANRLKENNDSRDGYEQAIFIMLESLHKGGKIVVTGVGKSGKIGQKIVSTMLSTSTSACFLHPVEALHGDLGIIQPNDVVLALSFSGNTEEILMLLPSLKHRSIPVIGLGGNSNSKLAKECAAWIDGHVKNEAGGSIPAPTTSTTLTLALGDAIALSLAKLKAFSKNGFALNHPGGSLGRQLSLKIEDILIDSSKVASVYPSTPLDVVIMEMTKRPRGSCVIVLNEDTKVDMGDFMGIEGHTHQIPVNYREFFPSPPLSTSSSVDDKYPKIVGIITHGDIHRLLKSSTRDNIFDIRAIDIMTHHPTKIHSDSLASEAVSIMKLKKLPLLPIMDKDNGWIGVVTLKDLQELL
ncbi:hypothetical protein BDB01DRAFT_787039 [Pilobolus umbonatus]|nr:hypothetical protein BDB01DRAFT_787039 [Pilobolus umbonatus]